jgi:uncharacterized protein (TIGR02996 family)
MDEASFRRLMAEQPHDALLRLAFADWLEERGDIEQAKQIRHECRFRAPLSDAERQTVLRVAEARRAARAEDVLLQFARPGGIRLEQRPQAEAWLSLLDPLAIARNFPRDTHGRFKLGESVLLTILGRSNDFPMTRAASYLCVIGPWRRGDPQILHAGVSSGLTESPRHRWNHQPHLWDRRVSEKEPVPDLDERGARCLGLLDQGAFEEALKLYDIECAPKISRVLNGETVPLPVGPDPHAERDARKRPRVLREALWSMAPWQFPQALEWERQRLEEEARRNGRLARVGRAFRLIHFSTGHYTQRRPFLQLEVLPSDRFRLILGVTTTQLTMPRTHWQRPWWLDAKRLG